MRNAKGEYAARVDPWHTGARGGMPEVEGGNKMMGLRRASEKDRRKNNWQESNPSIRGEIGSTIRSGCSAVFGALRYPLCWCLHSIIPSSVFLRVAAWLAPQPLLPLYIVRNLGFVAGFPATLCSFEIWWCHRRYNSIRRVYLPHGRSDITGFHFKKGGKKILGLVPLTFCWYVPLHPTPITSIQMPTHSYILRTNKVSALSLCHTRAYRLYNTLFLPRPWYFS